MEKDFFDDENQGDYAENSVDTNQKPPQQIGKGQKIAATGLAIFGVFIIVIWAVQFKSNLISPLQPKNTTENSSNNSSTCTGSDCSGNTDQALKYKDTDQDGLSDYDELNVYKTSPYLADSDSDGMLDGKEISSSSDPNCPEGRQCYESGLTDSDGTATSTIGNYIETASSSIISLTVPENVSGTDQQNLNNLVKGKIDASTLRQTLLQYGMDPLVLDQISDEELMASYQDTLSQPNAQATSANSISQ
jgi:hypothetical protein